MTETASSVDWASLIAKAAESHPDPVEAHTFLRSWPSASSPVLLACDDGGKYVVKGSNSGRTPVNEQVVGRLAGRIEAPVPQVRLVNVSAELIRAEPNIAHLQPGLSHGSSWIPNCTDRQGMQYTSVQENRERFARLAILYSWVRANDHQCIYEKSPPNRVWSVDHGHFFPNGPGWTIQSLRTASVVELDGWFGPCGLCSEEFRSACETLRSVTVADIASVVGGLPADWSVSQDERVALAGYIHVRRDGLIALVSRMT